MGVTDAGARYAVTRSPRLSLLQLHGCGFDHYSSQKRTLYQLEGDHPKITVDYELNSAELESLHAERSSIHPDEVNEEDRQRDVDAQRAEVPCVRRTRRPKKRDRGRWVPCARRMRAVCGVAGSLEGAQQDQTNPAA